jgi:Flp pilus assembly pilin Flp
VKTTNESRTLERFVRDTAGLSTVEYIIILVLIAIVGMAAWSKFGTTVKQKVDGSTDRVDETLGVPENVVR